MDGQLDTRQATALDRRQFLQRGAAVGGATMLLWAAPTVRRFGSPAFGENEGSPFGAGKDFSYIALNYRCDEGELRSIKFEFEYVDGSPAMVECETGSFRTPAGPGVDCDFDNTGRGSDDDCEKFSFQYLDGLRRIRVTADSPCLIEGVGVGKCGAEGTESGGECVHVTGDETTALTFALCAA